MNDDPLRQFAQKLIHNVKKHGFPNKMVSFDIEVLYAAAERNGTNLNKALALLTDIHIGHVKTPEKIVFYPADRMAPPRLDGTDTAVQDAPRAAATSALPPYPKMPALDLSFFDELDLDPEEMQGWGLPEMMAKAQTLLAQMSPEQLQKMQNVYAGMSDDNKAALVARARALGLFPQDTPEKGR